MPSPIGHVLGGIAAGSLASGDRRWPTVALFGLVAALPDVDILLPIPHRGPTHSIVAAIAAFVVALGVLSLRHQRPLRVGLATAIGLAVLSHTLLDWLGQDSSTPRGLMALWPFSREYFISDLNVFGAVDRRYWLPGFWQRNTISLAIELLILAPLTWLALRARSRGASSPEVRP